MLEQDRRFRKEHWNVKPCSLKIAQEMVTRLHYAKGGSNTAVYVHGLFDEFSDKPYGVAWWLPPTRVAAESVNRKEWQKVLSLTRFVLEPGLPTNAASFLLAKSIKLIRKDARFVSLVTYADFSQGHTGTIYKASNWIYVGVTSKYPRWKNVDGLQVSPKSTKNRTKSEMEKLGYVKVGSFSKHKFVIHL